MNIHVKGQTDGWLQIIIEGDGEDPRLVSFTPLEGEKREPRWEEEDTVLFLPPCRFVLEVPPETWRMLWTGATLTEEETGTVFGTTN